MSHFISNLGVVHNCQHLPISTESTNLGGGRGAEASQSTIFKMLIYLWNIIKINASKMYYMVLNTTFYT